MYWIVLFLTYVRLVQDRVLKNNLYLIALYHLWDLNHQIGDELMPAMLQPLKALVCMWGVMIHTEYQVFRTTWALDFNLTYDPHSCGCALCIAPTGRLFPATRYWEMLQQVGIPTCLCDVCMAQPHATPRSPRAAVPAAVTTAAPAAPLAAVTTAAPAAPRAAVTTAAPRTAASSAAPTNAAMDVNRPISNGPSSSGLRTRAPQTFRNRPLGMPELIPMGHGRPAARPMRPVTDPRMPRPVVENLADYVCERSPDGLRMTFRRIKEEDMEED